MPYNPLILSHIKRSERAQALFCGISSSCPDLQIAASLVDQDLRNILNAGLGHVQEASQYLQDPTGRHPFTIDSIIVTNPGNLMRVVLVFPSHKSKPDPLNTSYTAS